jgi:putative ABC transport system permease protein
MTASHHFKPVRSIAVNTLAVRALVRRPLRTSLMMLGMIVGICALSVLNSVGEGTRQDALQKFKNMLGTFDTVMIRPGAGRTRGMVSLTNVPPTLKFQDAEALITDLPAVSQVALVQNAFGVDVIYRDRTDSPAIFGVSPNWLLLRGEDVQSGRFVTEEDSAARARVAVLGSEVVSLLFPDEQPLGKTLRVGDVPFTVIGTLPSRGVGPGGGSLDDLVIVPVTTSATRLFNRDFLTMVIAQLRDPLQADAGVRQITELLRRRHRIATIGLDDFTVTNPKVVMAQVTRLTSTLGTILKGVAIFATIIGSAVIMSLMMSSVSERTRDIGVSRALGASRRDVLFEFLLEAVWCTTAAAMIGSVLGIGIAVFATRVEHMPTVLAPQSALANIALAIGIGVICGLYPAWKAARVDPALALRA